MILVLLFNSMLRCMVIVWCVSFVVMVLGVRCMKSCRCCIMVVVVMVWCWRKVWFLLLN